MSKVFTITEGLENMGALRTGGQGSVYKGRRMGPIITAVKLLPTPIHTESEDDKNYINFINEVEKLKKVNEVPNPNVVKILSSGITESGSFPFIEMEFIEGPDLEELLKAPHEKIFTIKEVIKLADQLACALCHCHGVGVKHGDIKSNNVKFNIHSGNYVLLDFGLSVMSDEQRRSSMRHAGAIEFMAPEQNEGQMLFQTDIYSYGVILYELLAGQVPFPLQDNGETARNTVMLSHLEAPVPNLLELRQSNLPKSWDKEQQRHEMQVPAWLLTLVNKCLEKQPENRYANGMELQKTIDYGTVLEIKAKPIDKIVTPPVEFKTSGDNLENINEIRLSKPLFGVLIVVLILSLVYSGYSFLHKPAINQPAANEQPVTPVNADSGNAAVDPAATNYMKRRRASDSLVKKAILDDIRRERENAPDSVVEDTVFIPPGN